MKFLIGGETYDVRLGPAGPLIDGVAGPLTDIRRRRLGDSWEFTGRRGDRRVRLWVTALADGSLAVQGPGGVRAIAAPANGAPVAEGPHGPVKTPMAGVVTTLAVSLGQQVAAGEALAVVEAMKMRFTLEAGAAGLVTGVEVLAGQLVTANQVIVTLSPLPEAAD